MKKLYLILAMCIATSALAQNSFPTNNAITLVEDTITHTITASVIGKGLIYPRGMITVPHGENQSFIIYNIIQGHDLIHLWIDGEEADWIGGDSYNGYFYEFFNVTANHTIVAEIGNVGINENENSDFFIYPNPTNGKLRITNYELRITNYELQI